MDGAHECIGLRRELLSDVAPGQLPEIEHSSARLALADERESLNHTLAARASGSSTPLEELPIDPEDRLFDSSPQSPQLSPMSPTTSGIGRYLTEEDSMPSPLREISPLLMSNNSQQASAISAIDQTLSHLRVVVAHTAQAEMEATIAEREAGDTLRGSPLRQELVRAGEARDTARTVSQSAQSRIQEYETASRIFGTREQVQAPEYISPITAMERNVQRWATQRGGNTQSLAGADQIEATHSHSHPSRFVQIS